jgi:hypothetical protein
MTDQELNEAVARKLGAEKVYWTAQAYKDGKLDWKPYSTAIEAAWEIVEYIFNEGLAVDFTSEYRGKWFEVQINKQKDLGDGLYEHERFWTGEADTAPRAICESFLKLP